MGVKRVWSTTAVVALTGALLLTSAPTASADYIRDRQWVIDVIDFKKVWSASQGQGVTVAVVDTGVDDSHPDLTGQVLKGKDFTGSDEGGRNDPVGHGTGMASIIAGHGHGTNNSAGVMGLAPKSKILPIVGGTKDEFENQDWAAGVRYAVDQGASVINLSFSDPTAVPGSEGAKAIAYAQQHDAVVVSGTGNDGSVDLEYPAKLPGVVAVSAIDESLNIWENSNSGKGVTLAAPGGNIVRANPSKSSGYSEGSGVSDATAYVSASAALVRAKYPDLTAGQVINRLIKSATMLDQDVKKTPDDEYGYGIIRPYAALTMEIPKGPKQGPLAQASSSTSTNSGAASGDSDSTSQAAKKKKKSSSGSVLLIAGIAGAVVVIGILVAVLRSRRNGGSGGPGSGGGTPPHGAGYPSQPPAGQQQHPNTASNQGYPTYPGQSPQHPNPYAQQPPHQGQ